MKKYYIVFIIAFLFGACQTKQDIKANGHLVPLDTTRIYNNNILSDTAKMKSSDPNTGVKKTVTTTTTTTEPLNNGASDVVKNKAVVAAGRKSTIQHKGSGATYVEPSPVRPKGISSAAKGAAIGGVGGAIVGGVIGHNAKGAIIGGVLGGGAGYAIGRSKDRRTGRVARGRAYRRHKRRN